jgi:hypothetical protein
MVSRRVMMAAAAQSHHSRLSICRKFTRNALVCASTRCFAVCGRCDCNQSPIRNPLFRLSSQRFSGSYRNVAPFNGIRTAEKDLFALAHVLMGYLSRNVQRDQLMKVSGNVFKCVADVQREGIPVRHTVTKLSHRTLLALLSPFVRSASMKRSSKPRSRAFTNVRGGFHKLDSTPIPSFTASLSRCRKIVGIGFGEYGLA